MLDTKALAHATATIVREHLASALEPVFLRLDALEARAAEVPEKGDRGEPGKDGADADLEAVRAFAVQLVNDAVPAAVEASVAAAVAALPPAERGEKGDQGDRGEPGADGKDGVGLAGMMISREGEAVVTLTDGTMRNLGVIVGQDGRDGRDGVDGKDGNDGADGRDGVDGKDLTDISVTQAGDTIELSFQIGEDWSVYQVTLPQGPAGADGKDAYPGEARGLFDASAEYRALDVVSFNGSEWRAKRDNPGDIPGDGWMLSAKCGKRGAPGERGERGPAGPAPLALVVNEADLELVQTLEDGTELKADLFPLAERIRSA